MVIAHCAVVTRNQRDVYREYNKLILNFEIKKVTCYENYL